MKTLLQVQNLSFTVQGGRKLLSDISLGLNAGELLVVLGRNGAGKSTLFKHLTKELPVAENTVTVFDQDLSRFKHKDLAKVRAVLPQFTHLNFGYRVLDVVLLGRIPHQTGPAETAEDIAIAEECLKLVDLTHLKDRNYLTLSGGEQQRVHLARTLAQIYGVKPSPILFLDEPTSSLDISHQHQVLKIAKDLTRTGAGVLAILHDLNLASQYADRILILADGRAVASVRPEETLTSEILTSAFNHPILVQDHPILPCKLVVSY